MSAGTGDGFRHQGFANPKSGCRVVLVHVELQTMTRKRGSQSLAMVEGPVRIQRTEQRRPGQNAELGLSTVFFCLCIWLSLSGRVCVCVWCVCVFSSFSLCLHAHQLIDRGTLGGGPTRRVYSQAPLDAFAVVGQIWPKPRNCQWLGRRLACPLTHTGVLALLLPWPLARKL